MIVGDVSHSEQVFVQLLVLRGDSMHVFIALALKQVDLVLDKAREQAIQLGGVF